MEIDITKKIKNFIDLNAWRSGHVLVLEIYKITQKFPTIEKFGLSDQIRRTTVSITSNISEGFSRQTKKDKLNFYHISLGSLSEVQNQIIIARDLKYIDNNSYINLKTQTITISKLLNGLIKSLKHNT